jgi:hypothetical protein
MQKRAEKLLGLATDVPKKLKESTGIRNAEHG